MAWFDTPELRAGWVEDFGSTHGDTTCHAATPRRIWELRAFMLVISVRLRAEFY
jgi:hypothetical protein